jgi:hypothetical protein
VFAHIDRLNVTQWPEKPKIMKYGGEIAGIERKKGY